MVAVVFRTVVLIVSLFLLVLFGWILGAFIDPFLQVMAAESSYGERGMEAAFRIGMALVLPLLGLAVLIWVHTAEFQNDIGQRRRF